MKFIINIGHKLWKTRFERKTGLYAYCRQVWVKVYWGSAYTILWCSVDLVRRSRQITTLYLLATGLDTPLGGDDRRRCCSVESYLL